MNNDIENFLKGKSKNAYEYFGAHRVSDGVCFRVYAPHAKEVEVVVHDKNYKMNRIDFRGVYEVRVNDIKEFDSYHYEILTNDNTWISKMDPYTFYYENNKSIFIDKDEYVFADEKWLSKEREELHFNGCFIKDSFNMDEQREFVKFLKKYNYNYVILTPYNKEYFYCVNNLFINESSLKTFIDNLHQVNIGVIFDFDTECFYDSGNGLNDFDGESVYNKKEDKYKDLDLIYFEFEKNNTKSYITSFINYYISKFHADGIMINDSDFNKELMSTYVDKIIIYKGNENKKGYANSCYTDNVLSIINKGFNFKEYLTLEVNDDVYMIYDYQKYMSQIKGNEEHKKSVARMLLTLNYISNNNSISIYYQDEEYLKALEKLANLYATSKSLYNKNSKSLLLNGKKHNCFAYEFSARNDYTILFANFGNEEEEKFDLGMKYYGYYKLIYDNKLNDGKDDLLFTRNKKVHDKTIAVQFELKPNQVVVLKRVKDI